MKYIINEVQIGKLNELMYDYINSLLPSKLYFYYHDDIDWKKNLTNNTTHISAYADAPQFGDDGETVLRVYLEKYFDNKELWKDSLPMIELELKYDRLLDDMFGKTKWHDAFLEWVNLNFPELAKLNIKSVGA